MLVSLEWLNDLITINDIDPKEIAESLTMSGLEVEEIEHIKPKFSKVFTAKIIGIDPHPDADKIQLPTVDYGFGKQQVVCGAKNIKVGQVIAFAIEGATVYSKKDNQLFTLKKTKIRGFESAGMICSSSELGLEEEEFNKNTDGILVLSELERFSGTEIAIGESLEKVLDLNNDVILHTAPTANRGDLMSMRGIAKEISAIYNRPLNKDFDDLNVSTVTNNSDFNIEIHDPDTCKYYALGTLTNICQKKSPDWMAKRLQSSGMRSINNIVDITNYVMLEYGQPLHAFDLDKLQEKRIIVRRANNGEEITTLDSVTRKLISDNVLITIPSRPVALAGVMGDETSEVGSTTTRLALESAFFTSATNRKNSRTAGIRTEASARFERGVDICTVKPALYRALELLIEHADAKITGIYETGTDKSDDIEVELNYRNIERILGVTIEADTAINILKNLGFKETYKDENYAKFIVPSYRNNDVTREIDLIEEISRIYGYNKIPEIISPIKELPKQHPIESLIANIKQILLGNGLNEVATSSFVGYPLLNWCAIPISEETVIKVTNPQSDEHTMLRQSMIPSMLQTIKYNLDHDIKNIWLFEIGKTYVITEKPSMKNPGVTEDLFLSVGISGQNLLGYWKGKHDVDFYTIKGLLENLLDNIGLLKRIEFLEQNNISYLHPGRSANIKLMGKAKDPKDLVLGNIGELHPSTNSKCKIGQPVYLLEMNLSKIIKYISQSEIRFKKIPQYPSVTRDIAFMADNSIPYADIVRIIKKSASSLLTNIEVFDVYTGEKIESGKRSLAIHLTLQDPNSTLVDEIVENEISKIKTGLETSFKVVLR